MKRANRQMVALLLALLTSLPACSVVMAWKQPDKKNVDLFRAGVARSELLAEFGPPIQSEIKNGKKTEVFMFTQGYSKGTKVGRALFHAAADHFTVGLWELIGTPTEFMLSGNEMAFQVTYDAEDKVEEVVGVKE